MKNREPDQIDEFGTKFWYDDNGLFHNDFGYPAIVYIDGYKAWYKHGIRHNENGSAIFWADGDNEWYIDGNKYTKEEFKQYKIKNFINEK